MLNFFSITSTDPPPCAGPRSRRGFTRQPESPNVDISGSRRFKHHQNPTRRPPEREREKAKMGAGVGKKSAKFWAPTFGPPPLGPNFFQVWAPPLWAPNPSLRAEALQAPTFSGFGPLRSSFYHFTHLFFSLCIFNCFYFLSFFDSF